MHCLIYISSAGSTCLTLKEILNELEEVTDWYQLGIQLGLKPQTLIFIERNHPHDALRCKTDVLNWWLLNELEISWRNLAEAVEAMGGHKVLADKLIKKIHPVPEG